jgi:hypothetical protein
LVHQGGIQRDHLGEYCWFIRENTKVSLGGIRLVLSENLEGLWEGIGLVYVSQGEYRGIT